MVLRIVRLSLLVVLLALSGVAGTRVRPAQVRLWWRSVRPLVGAPTGTRMSPRQVRIDPEWIRTWRSLTIHPGPNCYEMAVLAGEDNPVLITATYCRGNYPFWFKTGWKGDLSP